MLVQSSWTAMYFAFGISVAISAAVIALRCIVYPPEFNLLCEATLLVSLVTSCSSECTLTCAPKHHY